MTKFRNYNQGRVKELIENALREAAGDSQVPEIGPPYNYPEFDQLPYKHLTDESKSLSVKCYNTDTGEVLALCSIQEKYLNLIQDGKLTDRIYEYNLFRKYATLISMRTNGVYILCKQELVCAEDCTCEMCVSYEPNNNSEFQNEISKYDNPYYNNNLDIDQQSSEYWNNI